MKRPESVRDVVEYVCSRVKEVNTKGYDGFIEESYWRESTVYADVDVVYKYEKSWIVHRLITRQGLVLELYEETVNKDNVMLSVSRL